MESKMTDPQQQIPVPEPIIQPSEVVATPPPIKKSNKTLLLVIGGMLLVICICIVLCVALGGTSLLKIYQEREPVSKVIDSFMQAMVQKDTQKAFELFSTRAQKQIKMGDLNKLLEGNNYVLFDGYQRIEIGNLNISKAFNTNENLPQGTVAKVNGTIFYTGGFTGRFDAVLEKEGDTWHLFNINVTVPPNKLTP
jgi:hypothetical protein